MYGEQACMFRSVEKEHPRTIPADGCQERPQTMLLEVRSPALCV